VHADSWKTLESFSQYVSMASAKGAVKVTTVRCKEVRCNESCVARAPSSACLCLLRSFILSSLACNTWRWELIREDFGLHEAGAPERRSAEAQ
jgi:hypothetical protein